MYFYSWIFTLRVNPKLSLWQMIGLLFIWPIHVTCVNPSGFVVLLLCFRAVCQVQFLITRVTIALSRREASLCSTSITSPHTPRPAPTSINFYTCNTAAKTQRRMWWFTVMLFFFFFDIVPQQVHVASFWWEMVYIWRTQTSSNRPSRGEPTY